jgi:hypothetical protein
LVAKCRERLSVSRCAPQKFDIQRFDLRKLHDAEVQDKISNGFCNFEKPG